MSVHCLEHWYEFFNAFRNFKKLLKIIKLYRNTLKIRKKFKNFLNNYKILFLIVCTSFVPFISIFC